MGYSVDVHGKVKIAKENRDKLFEILVELDKKRLTWVTQGFSKLKTVKAVFEELGYEAKLTKNGYYVVTDRNWEKIGDDEDIWRAIAPVIMDGSYLKCAGEDHAQWRWKFNNGKLDVQYGRTVYD